MAGIMDKIKFIHSAVSSNDTSVKTINLLNELKNDDEPVPVYKTPVKKLATAALELLGIEKIENPDEDILVWKENLKAI